MYDTVEDVDVAILTIRAAKNALHVAAAKDFATRRACRIAAYDRQQQLVQLDNREWYCWQEILEETRQHLPKPV